MTVDYFLVGAIWCFVAVLGVVVVVMAVVKFGWWCMLVVPATILCYMVGRVVDMLTPDDWPDVPIDG